MQAGTTLRSDAARLREGELHVWVAELDSGDWGGAPADPADLLSPDERLRAARFPRPRDGARWARSRVLLRLLLGAYLGAGPASLRFQAGEFGKPRLASSGLDGRTPASPGAPLHFNLSHSGALATYVLARDQPVGIDVEMLDRRVRAPAVAERAFDAASVRRLRRTRASERKREFLRMWVRHEAALKCSGAGLAGRATLAHAAPAWIADLDLGEDGALAAVAAGEPGRLRCGRVDAPTAAAGGWTSVRHLRWSRG